MHVRSWCSYTQDILQHLTIILIDDCSPEPAYDILKNVGDEVKAAIKLFRVEKDIPWNQHQCRNIGAHEAKDEWLLMLDMDRIIPCDDMKILMTRTLDPQRHYKPMQIKTQPQGFLESDKTPVNQFLVTKEVFWKAGGYDVDYCGVYGGDGSFLRSMESIAKLGIMKDVRMIHYGRNTVMDANITTLDRNGAKFRAIRDAKAARGDTTPRNPIRCEYKRVELC